MEGTAMQEKQVQESGLLPGLRRSIVATSRIDALLDEMEDRLSGHVQPATTTGEGPPASSLTSAAQTLEKELENIENRVKAFREAL